MHTLPGKDIDVELYPALGLTKRLVQSLLEVRRPLKGYFTFSECFVLVACSQGGNRIYGFYCSESVDSHGFSHSSWNKAWMCADKCPACYHSLCVTHRMS